MGKRTTEAKSPPSPTSNNGDQEEKPRTIQSILDEEKGEEEMGLSPEILEKADLKLPDEFRIETMAEELLEHINTYHKAKAANKAARNSGDGQRAEQMFKLMSFSRVCAAVIEYENKGVKAIADEIAKVRAQRAKAARAAALSQED